MCFFFQAEDGIRDSSVTGVQTCALPIYQTIGDYLKALASTAAVPGGGSAAALGAAMGAALLSMVAKLSAKKAMAVDDREILTGLVPEFDQLPAPLLELSHDAIAAYPPVIH